MVAKSSRDLLGSQDLSHSLLLQAFPVPIIKITQRDLLIAPRVEVPDLVDALNRARRGTPLFGDVLALHVGACVLEKRNTGSSPLLRAPTDDTVLVDV